MSMVTKRPQLSLDDLHRLKWLLGSLLGLLSAWTVAFMEVDAWLLLALTTLAGVAALARPSLPARVPAWVHRLAFPVIVAVLVVDLYSHREPLPAFIRLNLMLILYRLISHRRKRDDLQLIVLGLFMVVVAGVLTVSLAFAVQILAFTACALGFLLTITLVEAAAPGAAAPAGAAGATWAVGVHWRELLRRVAAVADWRLVVLGGGLFAGVVMISGLLFLAIPRFELSNSFFLDRLINKQTRTGFSDEIRFGEVTDILQDNSIALSVDIADRNQVPAQPYWRMVVLDDYMQGGFRVSPALRAELNRQTTRTNRLRGTARFRPGATDWTFYFEAGVSRYLPLLGNFLAISFTETQSVGLSDVSRVVALQRDPPRMFAYRVSGMELAAVLPDADFALRRRQPGAPRPARQLETVLTEDDLLRLSELTAEITGGADLSVADFSRRVTDWLAQRHEYSLQSVVPPGDGDPLVRWIGSTAPGHCEFFAGALVLLAREAGHPARLVTGFRGGSWNGFSNNFTVRNANAHAWVEVFDDQAGGWLRVDPTPGAYTSDPDAAGERGEAALRRIADNSWLARLESLRVFWYRRIVNFDQTSQIELARVAKQAVDGTGRRLRERLEGVVDAVKIWWAQPWSLGRFGLFAGGIAAVTGLLLVWRTLGRGWWLRWRSAFARSGGADPVRREAGRWLARWSDEGIPDDPVRTELERLRYGPRASWPNPGRVFLRARQFRRQQRRVRRTDQAR